MKVIIDTDPGVDDILAILLALSAKAEELELLLLSVTYGNIDVQNCLRNVVSMFQVVEKEWKWREEQGKPLGFDALKKCKPIVAVGADGPLGDQLMMADYFHGTDGLGGVHSTHPHHSSPSETWSHLFQPPPKPTLLTTTAPNPRTLPTLFTPSHRPAHLEILSLLSSHPPKTITIIAIGPLTNLALAASHSPSTFLLVKQVLIMGGALSIPGNITPVAEFNTMADPTAAARIFALTSPNPASTMPPTPPLPPENTKTLNILPPYPPLSSRLNLLLFPLDITTPHLLSRTQFTTIATPLLQSGSPLAEWTSAFLSTTFAKQESMHHGSDGGLSLHDPLCVWYALQSSSAGWEVSDECDVRVETQGQWTRGMCVIDRRGRKMMEEAMVIETEAESEVKRTEDQEIPGDKHTWLSPIKGNRIKICTRTPGENALAPFLLEHIFRS